MGLPYLRNPPIIELWDCFQYFIVLVNALINIFINNFIYLFDYFYSSWNDILKTPFLLEVNNSEYHLLKISEVLLSYALAFGSASGSHCSLQSLVLWFPTLIHFVALL